MPTGTDLIAKLRDEILDSPEADSLWPDTSLLRHLNRAEQEVAIRTLCLSDTSTAGIAAMTAAPGWNALSPKILYVDDVVAGGRHLQFQKESVMRTLLPDYETSLTGVSYYYLLENDRIRCVPDLTGASAVKMAVRRLPLADFTLATSPEVPVHYELALLHYAAYLSYLLKDSQTLDPAAAATHLQLFTAMVGPEVSIQEQYDRRHRIAKLPPARAKGGA